MSTQPTDKPTKSKPSLDNIFCASERAHAVISMTINGFDNAEDDDILYSLYAAQREVKEIKEALDTLLYLDAGESLEGAAWGRQPSLESL
jgi:hypothetical protein